MADQNNSYLIIEARFYNQIADELVAGAVEVLDQAGISFDRLEVPGVLEIAPALAMAANAVQSGRRDYQGYILLGCVIRGETSHYDIVAGESARAIYQLSNTYQLAVGNGILTVENEAQALVRARRNEKNKGADAARAAMALAMVAQKFR